MSSSEDETQFSLPPSGKVLSVEDKRISFVNALKGNETVLKRSTTTTVMKQKEKAWLSIQQKFESSIGIPTEIEKLKKLLNNIKNDIKKKTDRNQTGNKVIKLRQWEKDFLKILECYEKPVIHKIPGAGEVGTDADQTGNDVLEVNLVDEASSTIPKHSEEKHVRKRSRPTGDTEETDKLSTSELQRLVLNEQRILIKEHLKLIHLQMEREEIQKRKYEIELKKLESEMVQKDKSQSVPNQNQNNFNLSEFLVLP